MTTRAQATADAVVEMFNPPPPDSQAYPDWKRWADEHWAQEADVSLAREALEYVREHLDPAQEGLSDYEYNLAVCARLSYVPRKSEGLVASLISYYLRAQEKLNEKKVQGIGDSKAIGTVGERLVFAGLAVIKQIQVNSDFGTSVLHKMADPAGNCIVAFLPHSLNPAAKYNLKGTVKKHETRDGVVQTQISRCAELTDAEVQADAEKVAKKAARLAKKAAKEAARV